MNSLHVFLLAVGAWARLRVRFVIAFAAALLLAAPARITDAQQVSSLNSLPRYALVIGNSKYAEAPLKNPRNDAEAIAGELNRKGPGSNIRLEYSIPSQPKVLLPLERGSDPQLAAVFSDRYHERRPT